MYRFSWTETRDCNEITFRHLLIFLLYTWIWVQTYFVIWNKTRTSAELVFNFMAELYSGQKYIMKLYGLEKDPLFGLIKQKWKRKSSRLTVSVASVDCAKLMLPKGHSSVAFNLWDLRFQGNLKDIENKAERDLFRQAFPWKPRLPSPGVNYFAHLWSVHGQSKKQQSPDYQVFNFSCVLCYRTPTKHVFRWSKELHTSCWDRVTYKNDFPVQWSGFTFSTVTYYTTMCSSWHYWDALDSNLRWNAVQWNHDHSLGIRECSSDVNDLAPGKALKTAHAKAVFMQSALHRLEWEKCCHQLDEGSSTS